jgi:hypothetical protein
MIWVVIYHKILISRTEVPKILHTDALGNFPRLFFYAVTIKQTRRKINYFLNEDKMKSSSAFTFNFDKVLYLHNKKLQPATHTCVHLRNFSIYFYMDEDDNIPLGSRIERIFHRRRKQTEAQEWDRKNGLIKFITYKFSNTG